MSKTLLNKKVAILVANGFNEMEMTETQKMLQKEGAHTRIISMNHGLVNSWTGTSWGHHFAADTTLSGALAVDYAMLVVPGGRRSIDKLKLTAHTKRFINGFLKTEKPLVLMGEAVELLPSTEAIDGFEIAGPEYMKDDLSAAGARWTGAETAADRHLLTIAIPAEQPARIAQAVASHFTGQNQSMEEAA